MDDVDAIMQRIGKMRENPKTAAEIAEWEWANEVVPRLAEVGLPKRFHKKITDWNQPKQARAFKECKKRLVGNGAVVALVGPRGTGKTTIAAQLIIERAEAFFQQPERWPVPYCKLTDLVNMFKPIYADYGSINAEVTTRRRDKFCGYPLRIIDELHECTDMVMGRRVLVDVIDRCYSAQVDVVLISNQTSEEFEKTVSDSVISRLTEHGAILPCVWESHRTPK